MRNVSLNCSALYSLRFADKHNFAKPNDLRALNLMNKAASNVLQQFSEVVVAYGQSDEYSFIFHPAASSYNRRARLLLHVLFAIE